jgi:hypothetical protein
MSVRIFAGLLTSLIHSQMTKGRARRVVPSVLVLLLVGLATLTAACAGQQATEPREADSSAGLDGRAPDAGAVGTPEPSRPAPPQRPVYVTEADDTSDAEGRFELRGLATGSYRVTFGEPADSTYTRIDGVQVNNTYGANLLNLRLGPTGESAPLAASEYQPNRRPHLIRGSVVDAKGAPLPGIRVRARKQ